MQRYAKVLSVDTQSVTVRLDDSPCAGCTMGCGGRCNLFRTDQQNQLSLLSAEPVSVGQRVLLTISEQRLRQAALHGYGRALLGLLLGALLGALLARGLGVASDPLVLLGLTLGIAAALWQSRSRTVNPVLTPVAADWQPVGLDRS